MPQFVRNVEELRERARQKMEEGAVTDTYKGDVQQTVSILNEALATEIVCVLRYMHHYFMATGVHGKSIANEFKEHVDAEREHADMIAQRIQQLGGKPDFSPRNLLERSASQYVEGETLAQMIREDLIAERVVIDVYHDMIRHFGSNDPTTRVMLEHILRDEEEHASDLSDLLYITDPETGETMGEDSGMQFEQKELLRHSHHRQPTEKEYVQPLRADSGRNPLPGWRPGEENPGAHPLAAKRHESGKAGPPGAPEFAAPTARHGIPSGKQKLGKAEKRKKPAA